MKAVFLDTATMVPMDRFHSDAASGFSRNNWDINAESLYASCEKLECFAETKDHQILDRCAAADIIITNKVVISAEHMKQLPQLKLICVAATGINNVDTDAARQHNIAVANVAGYSTQSVVQICYTLMLSLISQWSSVQSAMQSPGWQNHPQFVMLPTAFQELNGKTLGIIGFGTIGKAVAQVAERFGMAVLKAQLPGRESTEDRLPLNEFLPRCDIVSLHCPLTELTRELVDQSFLAQMKSSAILLNTARGGLVDEAALAQALNEKTIAGAGLDVLSTEPPSSDNPLLEPRPNLVLTPHIGWASTQARQRLLDEIAANIVAFQQQQKRNRIV